MKNYLTLTLLCVLGFSASAQTLGINYQAIILNPQDVELPGLNAENTPLVLTDVDVRFYINNSDSLVEFSEIHYTTTDEFGMINLLIGSGESMDGTTLDNVVWDGTSKTLEVWIDSDHAGCQRTRKSTSAGCIIFGACTIKT